VAPLRISCCRSSTAAVTLALAASISLRTSAIIDAKSLASCFPPTSASDWSFQRRWIRVDRNTDLIGGRGSGRLPAAGG